MRPTLTDIRFVVLTLLGAVLATGCDTSDISERVAQPNSSPLEIFENAIQSPVPDQVTDLQGYRKPTSSGYWVFLRFRADETTRKKLRAGNRFHRRQWNSSWEKCFALPPGCTAFDPPFDVHGVRDKQCYLAEIEGVWGTDTAFHYYVIDKENDLVYFHGFGS